MYYVIWNVNTKNDFASWWNQYSAVKKIKKSDSWYTHFNWNNAHHKSEFWSQFNQKIIKKTEIFCLICKKCNLVLIHLIYIKNANNIKIKLCWIYQFWLWILCMSSFCKYLYHSIYFFMQLKIDFFKHSFRCLILNLLHSCSIK